MSMNMSPPRLSEARALATLPAVKARMRKRVSRNMGWAARVSMTAKTTEQDDAAEDLGHDRRAGPAHGVVAVGEQAVGDAHQDQDEAGGEGGVAPPVDVGRGADASVLQLPVGPDGAEDPEGDRDQEDQVPLDGGQQAAEDEADEGAADGGHVVDPEAEPALVGREGVGDDGRGVGEEHGPAHPLADAHADEPDGRPRSVQPGDGQEDREDGEDGEAEVVHLHPAEHVAHPAQGHQEDGQDDHEAHEHPQHVAGVGRGEGVELDAPEDGREGDEDDGLVDEDHQGAQGDVREGDPLVAAVGRPGPAALVTMAIS